MDLGPGPGGRQRKGPTRLRPSGIELPVRYYRNYPLPNPLGYVEEQVELDRDHTAFLIIDVYGKGLGGEEPAADVPEMYRKWVMENRRIVLDGVIPAKAAARTADLPIVYLTNHLSPALNEHSQLREIELRVNGFDLLEAWREPSEVLYISDAVAPTGSDFLVKKQHYSGFFDTQLDSLLRSLNVHNIVAVGFESQVCLGTTLTEAMYRNYQVVVLRDAIATAEWVETAEARWANFVALRFIETHVGFSCTTEQWVRACATLDAS
jgi:ureidoacrylate peracid hydrolase